MSRRRLSSEERALWKVVTRAVAPLRDVPDRPDSAETPIDRSPLPPRSKHGPNAAPKVVPKSASKPASKITPKPVLAAVMTTKPTPPAPPAPLGRRFRQQLARGSRAIDGRLDLHGMTQTRAHEALLGFVRATQARGGKVALVITGKGSGGGDAYSERGVLKRQVPLWLRLPEFRRHVSGFEAAGIGHGGEGALYVTLRRARSD